MFRSEAEYDAYMWRRLQEELARGRADFAAKERYHLEQTYGPEPERCATVFIGISTEAKSR